jgi:hypothetical protein
MHQMTNWMGDEGFLRQADCKIRRHNPAGDMLFIRAKVTKKYKEGDRHLVAIAQEAHNQNNELSVLGSCIVQLPVRG